MPVEVKTWLQIRDQTIQKIKETAETLQEHHRNINISRFAGTSASIFGSLLAITGVALTPVTFGASLGLVVGGVAIAAAGGATAVGATIADKAIEIIKSSNVQAQLNHDFYELQQISNLTKAIDEIPENTRVKCQVSNEAIQSVFSNALMQSSFNLILQAPSLASVLQVGIEPFNVIEHLHSLSKGSVTKMVQELRRNAIELEKQKQAIISAIGLT